MTEIEKEQHDLRTLSKEATQEYEIYMKSHAEAPDYEDYCQAQSLEEASEIFAIRLNRVYAQYDSESDETYEGDWDARDLIDFVRKVDPS